MKCEICGQDKDPLNILPIKQSDGKLETLACDDCAYKTGLFCKIHKRPHQGFVDGTNACLLCINELAEAHKARALEIYESLEQKLKKTEWTRLNLWAKSSCVIIGERPEYYIIIAIASLTMRLESKFDDVLAMIRETGKIDLLIPDDFYDDSD